MTEVLVQSESGSVRSQLQFSVGTEKRHVTLVKEAGNGPDLRQGTSEPHEVMIRPNAIDLAEKIHCDGLLGVAGREALTGRRRAER